MAERPPFAHDAVLKLLAAHFAHDTLGMTAQQLAMHAGLPDPDCDRALAALCEAEPPLARVHSRTGGYIATLPGMLEAQRHREDVAA